MLPTFSTSDSVCVLQGDSVVFADALDDCPILFSSRSSLRRQWVSTDNVQRLLVRKKGHSICFSSWLALFSYFVCYIIGLSSEKQMRRSNTGGNITMVKHTFTIGDEAIVYLPRNAMRSFVFASDSDEAIAKARANSPSPKPARRSLVDFKPKAVFDWLLNETSLQVVMVHIPVYIILRELMSSSIN